MRILSLILVLLLLNACSYFEDEEVSADAFNAEQNVASRKEVGNVKVNSSLFVMLPEEKESQEFFGDHTLSGNIEFGGAFEVADSVSAGEGYDFDSVLTSKPVISENAVFVMDGDANISAHSRSDISQILWASDAIANDNALGGALAFYEGKIYASNGRGLVGVIDAATGALLWRKDFGIPLRSTPAVKNSVMIMISADNQTFAINTENGNILWSHIEANTSATILRKNIAATIENNIVYIPYGSGKIYALSLIDGSEIFSSNLLKNRTNSSRSKISGISTTPIALGNIVVAGGNEGYFTAHENSFGGVVWENEISLINTPWRADKVLFVITDKYDLAAIDMRSGNGIWVAKLPQAPRERHEHKEYFSSPILIDSKIYIANNLGSMYEFDAKNGKLIRSIEIPQDVYSNIAVAGGQAYFITRDAELVLLR